MVIASATGRRASPDEKPAACGTAIVSPHVGHLVRVATHGWLPPRELPARLLAHSGRAHLDHLALLSQMVATPSLARRIPL